MVFIRWRHFYKQLPQTFISSRSWLSSLAFYADMDRSLRCPQVWHHLLSLVILFSLVCQKLFDNFGEQLASYWLRCVWVELLFFPNNILIKHNVSSMLRPFALCSQCFKGVTQGCVFGPLLFISYRNYFCDNLSAKFNRIFFQMIELFIV